MDANILQQKLENHPDRIISVLEALGFENIKFNPVKNNFRFAREENRNPSSCVLSCSTLQFFVFSTNKKGNLFSLIMDIKRCSFPESLRFAASKAGLSQSELNIRTKLPFGGFYLKLIPNRGDDVPLQTYPEDILEPYANKYNMKFVNDGISLKTQEKFGVGYDVISNRITIPERASDGSLVGIMGRANYECEKDKRWLPLLVCSRSRLLYGYSENYKRIQETGNIVLFESEKAVQQCDSFGSHIALATCGCYVSDDQVKYIRRMRPKKVILAYDEGLKEEHLINECKKIIISNSILNIKVGYVWPEGLITPGTKKNIADLGRSAYKEGITKYVKWIER